MAGGYMAGDESTSSAPKKATEGKTTPVSGTVVIATATFNPGQPLLLDQAADLFAKQVRATHGEKAQLSNVFVEVGVHKVGTNVTYNVTGEVVS